MPVRQGTPQRFQICLVEMIESDAARVEELNVRKAWGCCP
jgi:hypothetical protein